jgi:AcrR family transcriptional regulator
MPKRPTTIRRGRPRSHAAASHAAIMDAVYELLQKRPASVLTMEAVATRAKVGKPTLYKWWPSKAALIMAMFYERLAGKLEAPKAATAEGVIRAKMRHLIKEFNGLFGKVMADLIAEGQSDPSILNELYEGHIKLRRESTVADIERGKANGEFAADIDPELLIDSIFGPIYYRMLLRLGPLTEQFGNDLISQTLGGVRPGSTKSHRGKVARA